MGTSGEQMLDHGGGGRADVGGPVQEPPRRLAGRTFSKIGKLSVVIQNGI